MMMLLVAAVVHAGDRKVAGLSVGMGFPQAPEYVQDLWKSGLGGAVSLGTTLLPELTLYGMIEAHSFPFDEDNIIELSHRSPDSINLIGDDASAISGLVMLKMNIMPPAPGISPYVTAGVGLASVDIPGAVVEYIDDTTLVYPGTEGIGAAMSLGAGIDAYINPDFGLFVEIRYMRVFAEPQDIEYLPVRLGVIIGF
jgi:hypothetical protein